MGNVKAETADFFAKNKNVQNVQVRSTPVNAMHNLYGELDQANANAIDRLIFENCEPMEEESNATQELADDVKKLKHITGTIRGIFREGVFLLGKQVYEARQILQKYNRTGNTFGEWLKIAFKQGRSTAYNALAYYEFHESLPNEELKSQLKEFPYKAAYLLASRDGEFDRKLEILKNHHDQNATEIIAIIDEVLPLPSRYRQKRKEHDIHLIDSIRVNLQRLAKRRNNLTSERLKQISELRSLIDNILTSKPTINEMEALEASNFDHLQSTGMNTSNE